MRSERPYLGCYEVLQGLLRRAIAQAKVAAHDRDVAALRRVCRRTARVLLGHDEAYTPVPGWNQPGAINRFAGYWLGAGDDDPAEQMEHCVLLLMIEMLHIADYAATPGVLFEQWTWQIDAIVQQYCWLFMGIDIPTQYLM